MEQETNSKSIKILLMRHSESEYNKIAYEWKKENNLPITHPENEDLRFVITPELIDAILTEKGIKQSQEAGPNLQNYPIKHVISSPFRRAVLTGKIALENFNGNPKWKLIKFFRETIKSQCDLGYSTLELAKDYPDLDLTEFKDKLWFLKDAYISLENAPVDHKEKMLEAHEENPGIESLVGYMKEICPVRVETPEQAYLRVKKGKEVLREYLRGLEKDGEELKDFEVMFVAHSNVLKHFTAESVTDQFKPVGFHYFQNAEILEFNFEY